jgi:membrane protease YdiL (CAAX protease family)
VVAIAALLLARRAGAGAVGVGLGAAAGGRSSSGIGLASFAMAFPLYHVVHASTGKLFESAGWPKTPNLAAERLLITDAPLELCWIAAFAVIVAPICEEIVFRGTVFPALRRRLGFHGGAIATGFLFALLHPPVDWAALVVLAYFLARAYERSGSLRASIIAHAANNALGIGLLLIQRHIHRA